MSVQFGNWSFAQGTERTFDPAPVRAYLAPYGPDGESVYHDEGIDILYCDLRETEESGREGQPYRMRSNQILVWDGRLDNREELIREFADTFSASASDVAVVAAAYRRWGLACLPRLVGDWAMSVWHPAERFLVLARDFMGTRSLFYSVNRTRLQWCTVLDPLVLYAGHSFRLNREYIAGWFGLFPASDLTPYVGVHSVPPATYVVIREDSLTVKEFWRFAPGKAIRYHNDSDYEERFRELLGQAVRRRLRSRFPVLAELSGGMDSSSIVCMADRILEEGSSPTPRLDTLSYHSPGEPNWNELPYISKVEERRGRRGFHIEVRADDAFRFDSDHEYFMATPGSLHSLGQSAREFSELLRENRSRVLLSGIGGDEALGGAPSPTPLLADLFRKGQLRSLCGQLVAWALALRTPVFSLVCEVLAMFVHRGTAARSVKPPAWLCPDFVTSHSRAIRGYPNRTHLLGPRPSLQENLATVDALRRQLSCYPLSADPVHYKRYPYLDRDLLEFLFSIPQDQLLRPNQRRSLMRRALSGIVPVELLHRKRKAFVIREPMMAVSSQYARLERMAREMIGASLGIVDSDALVTALDEARAGGPVAVTPILRVFAMERWFQNAARWRVLEDLTGYVPEDAATATRADRILRVAH